MRDEFLCIALASTNCRNMSLKSTSQGHRLSASALISSSSVSPLPTQVLGATLPEELVLKIFAHLGPVSSTCLGLTCKQLYTIHRQIHGRVDLYATETVKTDFREVKARLHYYIRPFMWRAKLVWGGRYNLDFISQKNHYREAGLVRGLEKKRSQAREEYRQRAIHDEDKVHRARREAGKCLDVGRRKEILMDLGAMERDMLYKQDDLWMYIRALEYKLEKAGDWFYLDDEDDRDMRALGLLDPGRMEMGYYRDVEPQTEIL